MPGGQLQLSQICDGGDGRALPRVSWRRRVAVRRVAVAAAALGPPLVLALVIGRHPRFQLVDARLLGGGDALAVSWLATRMIVIDGRRLTEELEPREAIRGDVFAVLEEGCGCVREVGGLGDEVRAEGVGGDGDGESEQ